MTVESGFDFRVRPGVLDDFAATVRGQSEALASVGQALGTVRVERAWFGKLPESGHSADCYEEHHEAELAALGALVRLLAAAAVGLEVTAEVYVAADHAVTEALGTVETNQSVVAKLRPGGLAEALR